MRKLIIIILLSLLTISCRKEGGHSEELVEVSISLPSAEIENTKSGASLATSKVDSTVRIFAYKSNNRDTPVSEVTFKMMPNNSLQSCAVDDDGKVMENSALGGAGSNLMYLPSGGTYFFDGISPAIKLQAESVLLVQNETDLLYGRSRTAVPLSTSAVELPPFLHKCSLIEIDVRVFSSITTTVVAMGDEGVILTDQRQRDGGLKFNMASGVFPTDGADTFDREVSLTDFTQRTDYTSAKNPAFSQPDIAKKPAWFVSDSVVIFPTIDENKLTVKTHLVIGQLEIKLASAEFKFKFEASRRYKFVLSQTHNGIMLYLTVNNWVDRGFTSNLGGTVAYFIGGWTGDVHDWVTNSGEDADYSISTWTSAVDWKGDFDAGFDVLPIIYKESVDIEEEIGKKV